MIRAVPYNCQGLQSSIHDVQAYMLLVRVDIHRGELAISI